MGGGIYDCNQLGHQVAHEFPLARHVDARHLSLSPTRSRN